MASLSDVEEEEEEEDLLLLRLETLLVFVWGEEDEDEEKQVLNLMNLGVVVLHAKCTMKCLRGECECE